MDSEGIKLQKKKFRRDIHEKLKTLTSNDIEEQSAAITQKALQLPEYKHAQSLSVFLAMPGKEVSTLDIVRQAFKDGKKVYVPYIHASKHDSKLKIMDMLRLRDETDLESLKPDAWGIPSLSQTSIKDRENALGGTGCLEDSDETVRGTAKLDLIFMPAVAFDDSLNRLGHGKGFYDRYLSLCESLYPSNLRPRRCPHLVGLALQEQILAPGESIPTDDFDWRVDSVITSKS